jgi:hypothetical protein
MREPDRETVQQQQLHFSIGLWAAPGPAGASGLHPAAADPGSPAALLVHPDQTTAHPAPVSSVTHSSARDDILTKRGRKHRVSRLSGACRAWNTLRMDMQSKAASIVSSTPARSGAAPLLAARWRSRAEPGARAAAAAPPPPQPPPAAAAAGTASPAAAAPGTAAQRPAEWTGSHRQAQDTGCNVERHSCPGVSAHGPWPCLSDGKTTPTAAHIILLYRVGGYCGEHHTMLHTCPCHRQ